jgi:3-polyprenyl-4-hydroxybenzoate decarboxylase
MTRGTRLSALYCDGTPLRRVGHLVRIDRPVSPEFEIAASVRKSSDTDGPAFVSRT